MASYEQIYQLLKKCQQEHLLQFYNELSEDKQQDFLDHLSTINFEEVNELYLKARDNLTEAGKKLDALMQPIPPSQFESEKSVGADKLEYYKQIGLKQIADNHVAVVLLAGGQGTRLGVSYPKGMYSVGLPSGKSLFQLQVERIRRLTTLAQEATGKTGTITWYIMTSGPTNKVTLQFLTTNNFFGLKKENVVLFEQGLLPCFDKTGKLYLDAKNKVALAPDGNGGIYRALAKNKILEDMESRGIKYVHVHSVDNILVKVADPVFVGYCVDKKADCGAKVVHKASPDEPVGVVCQVNGHFQVVEYSEITEATANKRNNSGDLIFNAGNICNHFFTVKFLRSIAETFERQLKLHVAEKKIPYINEEGDRIEPESPNGIKIEKFVFDVFQFTDKFVTWEVPRISEFSALKNSDKAGKDCPSTAKRDLLVLHKQYIENAGGVVSCNQVEISPLLSYSGENLESLVRGKRFSDCTILEPPATNGVSNGNH